VTFPDFSKHPISPPDHSLTPCSRSRAPPGPKPSPDYTPPLPRHSLKSPDFSRIASDFSRFFEASDIASGPLNRSPLTQESSARPQTFARIHPAFPPINRRQPQTFPASLSRDYSRLFDVGDCAKTISISAQLYGSRSDAVQTEGDCVLYPEPQPLSIRSTNSAALDFSDAAAYPRPHPQTHIIPFPRKQQSSAGPRTFARIHHVSPTSNAEKSRLSPRCLELLRTMLR
jgi:hypothetical protein